MRLALLAFCAVQSLTVASAAPLGTATAPASSRTIARGSTQLAASQVSEPEFELKVQTGASYQAGKQSELLICLEAKSPYHVNKAYPYRFNPKASDGIQYSPQVVDKSRASIEEQRALIPLVFTPGRAGRLTISGTFAFSVCTQDKCLMEKRALQVSIDVT